jgi:hypothetical protein
MRNIQKTDDVRVMRLYTVTACATGRFQIKRAK